MRRRIAVLALAGALTFPACDGSQPIPNPCEQFPDLPGCEPGDPGGGDGFDCDAALGSEILALTSEGSVPFAASSTGRYIVTTRRGAPTTRTLAQTYSMNNVQTLRAGFAASMSEETARQLLRSPGVLRVEPDGVKSIPAPPDGDKQIQDFADPAASTRLWSLDRVDQRALPLDGDYTPGGNPGHGVHVYVIDTGISEHVDFAGRLSYGFTSVGGSPSDGHGHGTHVAGTVGGGQFGVAPAVTLHSVRVLNAQGSGSDSGVIQGIEWVEQDCLEKRWPCVANMSLGGSTSDALDLALCRLIRAGVFVAVAAGNDDLGACSYSPARVKQAITAMASDNRDAKAFFSNTGPCGDCWAPGVDVTSARLGGGETTFSGTSMSSPHLAGAAARILGEHPGWDAGQVFTAILDQATPGAVRFGDTAEGLLYVGEGG
jgi:subtilisin family serine protease